MAQRVASREDRVLARIFRFIEREFSKQPSWVQVCAYLLLLLFFVDASARVIGGRYVVKGVAWDGNTFARNCEIRVYDQWLSTNSKGEYAALFGSIEYYQLLATRAVHVMLVRDEKKIGERALRLVGLVNPTFEHIQCDVGGASPSPVAGSGFSLLAGEAYAQGPTDRLYVDAVTLRRGANVSMVELELELPRASNAQLLSLGKAAGSLPMKEGTLTLPQRGYYFEVPRESRGKEVHIQVKAPNRFLGIGGFSQKFRFTMPTGSGVVRVPGDDGGLLVVELAAAG